MSLLQAYGVASRNPGKTENQDWQDPRVSGIVIGGTNGQSH